MGIKFKYQAAVVPPPSNELTRRFGQNLVTQQKQQDFAGQQQARQLGARDFQNATSNMSGYLQDLLDNGEISDESVRRQVLGLKGGLDTVMGSGFTDDQRRHYLDQYRQAAARVVAGIQPKAQLTPQQKFDQGIVTRNGVDYVPGANGRYEPLKQPEQPKLPEPPPPQPKTMEEDYNFGARKGAFRKDFNSLKQQMQEDADLVEGSPKVKDEDVLQRMQQDWEFEQKALGRQSPSAGALPAPTAGASIGGPQGNAWAGIAQANPNLPVWRTGEDTASTGRPFTYSSKPDVGDMRGAPTGQAQPVANRSGAFNFDKLAQEVAKNNALANLPYNDLRQAAQAQGVEVPPSSMTPEEIAALDAQTNATMDSTNAQLAENQARAAEINAGYAPRTNSLKRQADAMSNKTDRAESALRGELLPRSPQGERPKSMYDISDAQDKREAEQFAKNKAEYDQYKARRDQGDDALRTRENKPIGDPKTMKQDARQFSAEYQLYKRGGGALSTRDYITQMAKQGKLSDDLKAQLEHNYKMDLSAPALAGVKEQDVLSQKPAAIAEAKTKRDAEANRRKYARGMPVTQPSVTAPAAAPAAAASVVPPAASANIPIAAPDSGKPPSPKRVSPTVPPATPGAVPGQQAPAPTAAPALPKAPKPNFARSVAEAKDDDDRAVIRQLQVMYDQGQPPAIANAIAVFVHPSSTDVEREAAVTALQAEGIDITQLPGAPPKPLGEVEKKLGHNPRYPSRGPKY